MPSIRLPNITALGGILRFFAPRTSDPDPECDFIVLCGTSTPTKVDAATAGAASVELVGANLYRRNLIIWNNTLENFFLAFGTTAVVNDASEPLEPGKVWKMPTDCIYTGEVHGIWENATTGSANVTEWSD